jgi:two-component system, NtrC family, response regulator HydG
MSLRKLLFVSPSPCGRNLREQLRARNWQVFPVGDLAAAESALRQLPFFVAVLALDGITEEMGADFESCADAAPGCEWIGMFSPSALKAPLLQHLIINHFFDYHTQPAEDQFLCRSLGHAYGRALLRNTRAAGVPANDDLGMVGRSAAMEQLRRLIRKVGRTDAPVLIDGESGSGKELVAQAVHTCSQRAKAPFVAVNCGAIAPTLIHSELFGHERGAFSGASSEHRGLIEAARGGTLFLDEIAELPLDLQTTLLRFLQDKTIMRVGASRLVPVDTRVIAASHVSLGEAVAAGRFREDLYYRLNVLPITVPPLRDRKEDVPLLASHFYERCAGKHASTIRAFGKGAMGALVAHSWPGNVRELFNRVQRAVVMAEYKVITPADLGLAPEPGPDAASLELVRLQAEKSAISVSLDRASHNITLAAKGLGVSRMTMYRLMAKHSITPRAA